MAYWEEDFGSNATLHLPYDWFVGKTRKQVLAMYHFYKDMWMDIEQDGGRDSDSHVMALIRSLQCLVWVATNEYIHPTQRAPLYNTPFAAERYQGYIGRLKRALGFYQ